MTHRVRNILSFSSAAMLLLALALPWAARAAEAPIHIESNRMTSTEKSNSVVFSGDVDAKQGDVRIRADEMTVFYHELDSGSKGGKDKDKK